MDYEKLMNAAMDMFHHCQHLRRLAASCTEPRLLEVLSNMADFCSDEYLRIMRAVMRLP